MKSIRPNGQKGPTAAERADRQAAKLTQYIKVHRRLGRGDDGYVLTGADRDALAAELGITPRSVSRLAAVVRSAYEALGSDIFE